MATVEEIKMTPRTTVVQASSIAKAAASEGVAQFWTMVSQYRDTIEKADRDKSR